MVYNPFIDRPRAQVNYPYSSNINGGINYNTNPYSNNSNNLSSEFNSVIEQKGTMEVIKYQYESLTEVMNDRNENSGIMISLSAKKEFEKYSGAELRSIDYRNRKNGVLNNYRQNSFNINTTNTNNTNPFMNSTNTSSPFSNVPNGNNISFNNNYPNTNQFINNNQFNNTNNPFNTNNNTNNNQFNTTSNTNNNPFFTANPFSTTTNTNNNYPFNSVSNTNNNPFNTSSQSNNNPFNMTNNSINTPFNTNNNQFTNSFILNNNSNNNPFNSNTNPFTPYNLNNNFIINANTNPTKPFINNTTANQSIISNVSNIPLTVNPLTFSFGSPNQKNQSSQFNSNQKPSPSPLHYIQPYFDLKNNQFFIDNCSPILGDLSSSDYITMSLINKLNSSTLNLYKENNKENVLSDQAEIRRIDYMPSIAKSLPSFEKTKAITQIALPNQRENQPIYDYQYNNSEGYDYYNDERVNKNDNWNDGKKQYDDYQNYNHNRSSISINCNKIHEKNNEKLNYYQSSDYLKEIESLANEACTTRRYHRPSYDIMNKSFTSNNLSLIEGIPFKSPQLQKQEDKSIEIQRNQETPIKNQLIDNQSSIPDTNPNMMNQSIKLTFSLNQPKFGNTTFELNFSNNTSFEVIKFLVMEKIYEICSVKLKTNQITFYTSKGIIDSLSELNHQNQSINITINDYEHNKAIHNPVYPKITKYQTIPTVDEIMKMTHDQLSHINNLTIYNEHGRIVFKEECDLNKVDVDRILTIKPFYLSCYNELNIPPCGSELNKPARIELFSIVPDNNKANEDIITFLKETVTQLGGIFIDYIDDTLIFDVEQFKNNEK